jgi:hypothetical protein
MCYFSFVNTRFPNRELVLALMVTVMAASLWLLFRPQPDMAGKPPALATQAGHKEVTPEISVAPPSAGTDQPEDPAEAASRGEPGQAVQPGASPNGRPRAESHVASSAEQLVVLREVESQFSAALDGDQSMAVELSSLLNTCLYNYDNRARVEQAIARGKRAYAEGNPVTQFRPTSPAQQFETFQEFESSLWDTYFRCEAARSLVNESFWSNLEQQADAGNPVARYLFATLMRDSSSQANAFDQWDETLELREQSREYTWRNLEEREPLGLLALVQTEGMGLRGTGSVGSVLALAAVKCGLSTPDLLRAVDHVLAQLERQAEARPELLEQLNAASDEAKQMFCK